MITVKVPSIATLMGEAEAAAKETPYSVSRALNEVLILAHKKRRGPPSIDRGNRVGFSPPPLPG